jgi:ABC-type nitrate/sulfonate/bicarbonate transport system permease component
VPRRYKSLLVSLASSLGLLSLWFSVSYFGVVSDRVLPSPWGLYSQFITLVTVGYTRTPLWVHFVASLLRTFTGFAAAVIVGVPLGLVMGYSWVVSAALTPIVSFIRPIPAISFIPLVILYFGIGEASKVAVVFITSLMYVILNCAEGVKSVPDIFIRVAVNMGVTRWQLFTSVIFPAALPYVMVGIKTGIAVSWALVVAAELVGAQQGLGYIIMDSSTFFRIDDVYIGIAMIGLIGFALERVVNHLQNRYVHWVRR